ncbi:peptide deformylase [Candidatus Gottesmanbacteria bacterium]|nr:peptide deformylase [Candidatus Gottesmanbacteria bacterium]
MKPIVHVPNQVLTTQTQTVTVFDKRLTKLIEEMTATLIATKNPKGVGLAAPQIGQPWRVFITRPKEESVIRVFINPEIIKRSDEETDGVPERENKLEGCLSIPKIWGKVKRAKTLSLRFQDEQGRWHEEQFAGFLATIIQHETDHTNGILFTQRVLEQKGTLFQTGRDKDGKEVLEEITI